MTVPDDRLPAAAFEQVRPAYGTGSLADLLPSVSAVLGVPGAVDVLGLGAHLDGVERIGVLLVDGMGTYQLPVLKEPAPFVADLAGMTLTSGFPSTTPVSLTTLGTGATPGEHGILGFTVRRPEGGLLSHIFWDDDPDPRAWQPLPTRMETAAAAGVETTVVNRPEFEGKGLTLASSRGARYVGAAAGEATAAGMLAALTGRGPALVYGYHGDLDRAGHEAGVDSPMWRDAAVGVDALVERLVSGLPDRAALLITADHGQLNVPDDQRFDIGTDPALRAGVETVAGEPRVRYLHVTPGARDDVMAAYRAVLGASASVLTRDEAIDGGWFGPVPAAHRERIGDVVVMCRQRAVVLATDREPPGVARLIAYHGSATAAEMTIPLLIARTPEVSAPGSVVPRG